MNKALMVIQNEINSNERQISMLKEQREFAINALVNIQQSLKAAECALQEIYQSYKQVDNMLYGNCNQVKEYEFPGNIMGNSGTKTNEGCGVGIDPNL